MLKEREIFISGSSRGIGAASARLAHGYGARVILHGKEESESLISLSQELDAPYFTFDIREEKSLRRAAKEIGRKHPDLDGLVHSAGTLHPKQLDKLESQDYLDAIKTHLLPSSLLSSLLRDTIKRGSIVNIASNRSIPHLASERSATYSAAKAALVSLTVVQAKEYAPAIRVNCLSPGWTKTEMAAEWNEASRQKSTDNLLQRAAESSEVAEAVCFLLSDKSSFLVGQNILLDGGYDICGK